MQVQQVAKRQQAPTADDSGFSRPTNLAHAPVAQNLLEPRSSDALPAVGHFVSTGHGRAAVESLG